MIATHTVSKLFAVLMTMVISASLKFERLPSIGTKNWEERLEGCFETALSISIIKIALFDQEKVIEKSKFEIDYKGIMVLKPGETLPNGAPFSELYSYEQLFIELLIKFKLSENPMSDSEQKVKDQAKSMADWLLSRYKTNPYHNKCHALSGAIHAVLLYLEKEDLTIKENGERWEINGHEKDYNIVRSLFLTSLLKGVVSQRFSTYDFLNYPKKDEFSFSFCQWSEENKKCEIKSEMIWEKFNQYKDLLSLGKSYEEKEEFNSNINDWVTIIEIADLKKAVDQKICSSIEFSQFIVAHRFIVKFWVVSAYPKLIYESMLQSTETEAGREDKIDRIVLAASEMDIASPNIKLRRVAMKSMMVQIIYEHFRNGLIFADDQYNAALKLVDFFKGKKIPKEEMLKLTKEEMLNPGERIKGLLKEIGLGNVELAEYNPHEFGEVLAEAHDLLSSLKIKSVVGVNQIII